MTSASQSLPVSTWVTALRLPFTTVAVVPFAVGIYLASGGQVYWPTAVAGLVAVLLICIGCYLFGEVTDQIEDRMTIDEGRTKFSGGTLSVVSGGLKPGSVSRAAVVCFVIALLLGIYISVAQKSLLLFGLGVFGGVSAVIYSVPPIRLVARGLGELFIAVCYGWLTLVTGYACATGHMPPESWIYFWPVSISIFNVIFINEFPDFNPDSSAGKRNLLVRMGRERGAILYSVLSVMIAFSLVVLWFKYRYMSLPYLAALVPGVGLSLVLAWLVVGARRWKSNKSIEPVCALTIVLNHICSLTVGVMVTW